jgi:hypothetical protein
MSILEFMKENDLAWQPSFSGELSRGLVGYRGALIIEAGKQLSPDRVLPPKIQARQVLLASKESSVAFFHVSLIASLILSHFLKNTKHASPLRP